MANIEPKDAEKILNSSLYQLKKVAGDSGLSVAVSRALIQNDGDRFVFHVSFSDKERSSKTIDEQEPDKKPTATKVNRPKVSEKNKQSQDEWKSLFEKLEIQAETRLKLSTIKSMMEEHGLKTYPSGWWINNPEYKTGEWGMWKVPDLGQ